jgi:hypothetical protein
MRVLLRPTFETVEERTSGSLRRYNQILLTVPVQQGDNEYDQEELRTSDDAEGDERSYDRKAVYCATTEVVGEIAIDTCLRVRLYL